MCLTIFLFTLIHKSYFLFLFSYFIERVTWFNNLDTSVFYVSVYGTTGSSTVPIYYSIYTTNTNGKFNIYILVFIILKMLNFGINFYKCLGHVSLVNFYFVLSAASSEYYYSAAGKFTGAAIQVGICVLLLFLFLI